MTNKFQAMPLYQMFPNGTQECKGVVQLLLHFRWTWVGMLYMNNENGENFVQNELPTYFENGICFDFVKPLPNALHSSAMNHVLTKVSETLTVIFRSPVNVVAMYGDLQAMESLKATRSFARTDGIISPTKVWILIAQMDFATNPFEGTLYPNLIHGALSLAVRSREVPDFQTFLQARNPFVEQEYSFVSEFGQKPFHCLFPGSWDNTSWRALWQEKVESLPDSFFEMEMTGHSYSIYNAVYVVAHALHGLYSSTFAQRSKANVETWKHLHENPWQVMFRV